jgi:hypothetical protein
LADGTNGKDPVVRTSRLAFDQPGRLPNGDALWPSDHRGVLADIELAPVERPRINNFSKIGARQKSGPRQIGLPERGRN